MSAPGAATPGVSTTVAELEALVRDGRASKEPQRLLDVVPYARFLGLVCTRQGERLRVTMRYAPHLVGDASVPALHGGTLAGLLESTAAFHALFVTEVAGLPKTITLTIDYLRSARPEDTHCEATVVRQGRRFVVVSARAFQSDPDKPVASATVHLLVA
ncbi:MAG: PaaI family thioesterase [Sandaracinaceae bacterium]